MQRKDIITSTLDPEENQHLLDVLTGAKAIFCDIDFTLLDISEGHANGVVAVGEVVGQEIAREFDTVFNLILNGHRFAKDKEWDLRPKFNQIMTRMRQLQLEVVEKYGEPKHWSKGCMIWIAAERLGKTVSVEQVIQARDAYWTARINASKPYEFLQAFAKFLKEHAIKLILMTGSHAVMDLKEVGGELRADYDADFSARQKIEALTPLIAHFFQEFNIITGDPHDKPSDAFFERVLGMAEGLGIEIHDENPNIVAIGDSELGDLEWLRKNKGCSTVLVDRSNI